jgi:hypothetical protein
MGYRRDGTAAREAAEAFNEPTVYITQNHHKSVRDLIEISKDDLDNGDSDSKREDGVQK